MVLNCVLRGAVKSCCSPPYRNIWHCWFCIYSPCCTLFSPAFNRSFTSCFNVFVRSLILFGFCGFLACHTSGSCTPLPLTFALPITSLFLHCHGPLCDHPTAPKMCVFRVYDMDLRSPTIVNNADICLCVWSTFSCPHDWALTWPPPNVCICVHSSPQRSRLTPHNPSAPTTCSPIHHTYIHIFFYFKVKIIIIILYFHHF